MKARGRKPKVKAIQSQAIEQPITVTCSTCHGTGIEEFNHGLVSRKCQGCQGTGKVKIGG